MTLPTEDNDCKCMQRNCSDVHRMLFHLLFLGTSLGDRYSVLILAWDCHCVGMESVSLSLSFGCMHVTNIVFLWWMKISCTWYCNPHLDSWLTAFLLKKFFFNGLAPYTYYGSPVSRMGSCMHMGLPNTYRASQKPIRVWDIPHAYGPSNTCMGQNMHMGHNMETMWANMFTFKHLQL